MSSSSSETLVPNKLLVALLVMMIGYIFPAVWYASQISTRVQGLENHNVNFRQYMERLSKTEGAVSGIQIELRGLKSAIKRIDKNMQKIADNLYDVRTGQR